MVVKDAPVTGSATYTGGAAGKWAIASTTEDTTDGGHFTATATLGVDFDANTLPTMADAEANKNGRERQRNSINNFMTGDVSRPDWTVTLTYDGNTNLVGCKPRGEPAGNDAGHANDQWASANGRRAVPWMAWGSWERQFLWL